MNRPVALLGALVLTAISVSSACMASPGQPVAFTLQAYPGQNNVHLSLNRGKHGNMSSSFAPGDLAGLDLSAVRQAGQHPVRFAYIRGAGRIDCNGYGGNSVATGQCNFAPSAAFSEFLAAQGVGRPTIEQSYELMMTDATRDLVEALAQYHYPRPGIEKLVELAAVASGAAISPPSPHGGSLRRLSTS